MYNHNNKDKNIECIAKMFPDKKIKNNNVKGFVNFKQREDKLIIEYNIKNLSDGKHGFHIHKCGDITKSCSSGCEHFNPYNNVHGSLENCNSHAGDLGNIISINGLSKGILITKKISINPCSKNSIIGRMVIVHKKEDDLGLGNNPESLKTGNAGKRLSCGIIGIKSGL
jgi:Cu-Zn family superoxide dismutase